MKTEVELLRECVQAPQIQERCTACGKRVTWIELQSRSASPRFVVAHHGDPAMVRFVGEGPGGEDLVDVTLNQGGPRCILGEVVEGGIRWGTWGEA